MRGPNFPFAPTKTYCPISVNLREKWKPLFLFSLCSFPPSLSFFFFFLPSFLYFFSWSYPHRIFLVCYLLILSPSFLSFLLFFFLIHPHFLLLFILLLSFHFLFISFFSFLSFSFLFLFLLFSSLFASPTPIDQKWGKLPPVFLPCHLSSL